MCIFNLKMYKANLKMDFSGDLDKFFRLLDRFLNAL